jgi:hypothetical protein
MGVLQELGGDLMKMLATLGVIGAVVLLFIMWSSMGTIGIILILFVLGAAGGIFLLWKSQHG